MRFLVPALGLVCVLLTSCASPPTVTPVVDNSGPAAAANVPEELKAGADLFRANCANCHGADAQGTDQGPPFIHPVYVPGHHGEQAFVNAALTGTKAHHWQFGDMPPVPGVTQADALQIVQYVRYLQRQGGLIP